jgi:hypothetical protein
MVAIVLIIALSAAADARQDAHFLVCFTSHSLDICCAFFSCSRVSFLAVASLNCARFVKIPPVLLDTDNESQK